MSRLTVLLLAFTAVCLGPSCQSGSGEIPEVIPPGAGKIALPGGLRRHAIAHRRDALLLGGSAGAAAGYLVAEYLGTGEGVGHEPDSDHAGARKLFDRALRTADLEEAVSLLDRAAEIDSAHAEIWNNRGVALLRLDRRDEARESFRKALSVYSGYRPARENLDRLEDEAM